MTQNWLWPQWTVVTMMSLSLLISIAKDGKPRGNFEAGYSIANFLLWMILLNCGGFFK
jgi:hypothetical protein